MSQPIPMHTRMVSVHPINHSEISRPVARILIRVKILSAWLKLSSHTGCGTFSRMTMPAGLRCNGMGAKYSTVGSVSGQAQPCLVHGEAKAFMPRDVPCTGINHGEGGRFDLAGMAAALPTESEARVSAVDHDDVGSATMSAARAGKNGIDPAAAPFASAAATSTRVSALVAAAAMGLLLPAVADAGTSVLAGAAEAQPCHASLKPRTHETPNAFLIQDF